MVELLFKGKENWELYGSNLLSLRVAHREELENIPGETGTSCVKETLLVDRRLI